MRQKAPANGDNVNAAGKHLGNLRIGVGAENGVILTVPLTSSNHDTELVPL